MSKRLGYPDQHHLEAAIGWLMLDNTEEARREVNQISLLGRLMPEALVLRWQIDARAKQWRQALSVAEVCTRICPSQPAGWLCMAYALYRLDEPRKAWQLLRLKADLFPNLRGFPYLMACFAAKAGLEREAEEWLAKSAAAGGPSEIREGPLEEGDLVMAGPPEKDEGEGSDGHSGRFDPRGLGPVEKLDGGAEEGSGS